MIAFLLTPIGRYFGGVIGIILAVTIFYNYAKWQGASGERAKQDKATGQAIKTRQEVDREIQNSDDYHICIALGGLPDECQQLRGVAKNAPAK